MYAQLNFSDPVLYIQCTHLFTHAKPYQMCVQCTDSMKCSASAGIASLVHTLCMGMGILNDEEESKLSIIYSMQKYYVVIYST